MCISRPKLASKRLRTPGTSDRFTLFPGDCLRTPARHDRIATTYTVQPCWKESSTDHHDTIRHREMIGVRISDLIIVASLLLERRSGNWTAGGSLRSFAGFSVPLKKVITFKLLRLYCATPSKRDRHRISSSCPFSIHPKEAPLSLESESAAVKTLTGAERASPIRTDFDRVCVHNIS